MSAKELTKLTLKDLWKESNSLEDFWQKEEDAVKEFKRMAIEAEREMLIGFKPYERQKDVLLIEQIAFFDTTSDLLKRLTNYVMSLTGGSQTVYLPRRNHLQG